MQSCRVCGSERLKLIFKNDKCPKYSHKYLLEGQLANDGYIVLSVCKCEECGMMQVLENFPEEEYVADYQRNISFSPSAVEHVKMMVDKLVGYGVRDFIEIGCGNGLFSEAMQKRNVKVLAFEPSKAAFESAKSRGIEVHNRFFDDNLPKSFSGYNGFALRFVLEHVPNPVDFLKAIGSRCIDGAVGLVEVPDGQKQIMQKRWFEFFREHTLYFTPETLISTISRAGFEILELHSTINGEFLSAIVRKSSKVNFDWAEKKMKQNVLAMIEPGKRTWAWGASGGGITLLASCGLGPAQIEFIVDSDKNKWGMYASGSRIKIVPPDFIHKTAPDNIIILSLAYAKEIRDQVRSLGFKGKIGVLWPEARWLGD